MKTSQEYQLLSFFFSPGSHIDISWIKSMGVDKIFKDYKKNVNETKLLSEYLLDKNKFVNFFVKSLSQEEKAIFTLSAKKMNLLVVYLGMFFCQKMLKNQVVKSQVIAVKSRFGGQAYLFGLKKAPYLLNNCEFSLPDKKHVLNVSEEIIYYGMAGLRAYLSVYPVDVQQRVLWKLPYKWKPNDYQVDSHMIISLMSKIRLEIR